MKLVKKGLDTLRNVCYNQVIERQTERLAKGDRKMSHLNPIEGTYRIKANLSNWFSKLAMSYQYKIIDSRKDGRSVFIVPVTQNGDEASTRQVAKLCEWVSMKSLEEIQN